MTIRELSGRRGFTRHPTPQPARYHLHEQSVRPTPRNPSVESDTPKIGSAQTPSILLLVAHPQKHRHTRLGDECKRGRRRSGSMSNMGKTALRARRCMALIVLAGALVCGSGQPSAFAASQSDPISTQGYYLAAGDGGVFSFGHAVFHGSLTGVRLSKPIVGIAGPADGSGYYLAGGDGGVFAFGSVAFHGSGVGETDTPIVGIAVTPDSGGYWLVGADGSVFAFGDAQLYGSLAGHHLDKPIVGIAATSDGGGYWLVGGDGGVFSFGDAPFFGSAAGKPTDGTVVGITAPPGGGYVLTTSEGAVLAYAPSGEYPNHGDLTGDHLTAPIVGIAFARNGSGGYWMTAGDGGVFSFGDTVFFGSEAGTDLAAPVVAISSVGQGQP